MNTFFLRPSRSAASALRFLGSSSGSGFDCGLEEIRVERRVGAEVSSSLVDSTAMAALRGILVVVVDLSVVTSAV